MHIIQSGEYSMKVTASLIVAGLMLFGASLNDPFHFDDTLITADSNVTNPARWAHFFNPFHLRQFTFFTFYLNHLAGGLNPGGYHAVNVAIHIANAVLLFYLLKRFAGAARSGGAWTAAVAAAVFLAHPVQTEPVLYVYERSTLLACGFSLAALLAAAERRTGWAVLLFFLAFESKESALAVPLVLALFNVSSRWLEFGEGNRGSRRGNQPALIQAAERRTGWAVLLFFLAFESKESALAVPLVLALFNVSSRWLEFGEGNREAGAAGSNFLSRIGPLLRVAAPVAALAGFALALLADEKTVGFHMDASPLAYLQTQTRVIYTYLRLLFFPYPQSLEYEFHDAGGFLAAAGLLLMVIAAWRLRSYSILAFFILLAPTSSIIPSADMAFEHRLYLPMLAFSLRGVPLVEEPAAELGSGVGACDSCRSDDQSRRRLGFRRNTLGGCGASCPGESASLVQPGRCLPARPSRGSADRISARPGSAAAVSSGAVRPGRHRTGQAKLGKGALVLRTGSGSGSTLLAGVQ